MESTGPLPRYPPGYAPQGPSLDQSPMQFEKERRMAEENPTAWSSAETTVGSAAAVDLTELQETVAVLQRKISQSIQQQSARTSLMPRTPNTQMNRDRRSNGTWSSPASPTLYTDPGVPPPLAHNFQKQPTINETDVKYPTSPPYPAPYTTLPLPPRNPRQSIWRRSIMHTEPVGNRRASTLMFGPGGPAAAMDPMMANPPNDPDEKTGLIVEKVDPSLKEQYLYKLSKALMAYGAPGHRLERYMIMTARALNLNVEFTYLPDSMTMYIEDSVRQTGQARLIKGAGTDLGRWLDAHNISKHVINNEMSIEDALTHLHDLENRKPEYNDWFRLFIYGLAGIGIAPFAYGARFVDLPLCFIFSVGLGVLQTRLAPRNYLYSVLFEVSAAILFSFLGRMIGSIKSAQGEYIFCYSAISEAAINLIQPGYWITNACLELMHRQIAASGARIMYAVVYALLLAYGIAVGGALYGVIDHDAVSADQCSNLISPFWNLFFVPFFSIQVAILSGARFSQIPPMVFICFTMYSAFFFTNRFLGGSFTLAATAGALTMGLLGNAYGRGGIKIEKMFQKILSRGNNAESSNDTYVANPESGKAGFSYSGAKSAFKNTIGYTCAAATMVPSMIVLVPSGLANRGSHVAGIITADSIVRNGTSNPAEIMTAALPIYLNVIQICLSIAVGLSVGALILYPFGKNRNAVMSW